MPSDPKALKEYRAAIRQAWLGVAVLRKKLTGHETKLVARWFENGVPVAYIIEAIRRTIARAKAKRLPLYSLGIISSDLVVVQQERARMHVGAHPSERAEKVEHSPEDWRAQWKEDLEEIADGEPNPESAAMYRELLRHLPTLSREEARARWHEIANP